MQAYLSKSYSYSEVLEEQVVKECGCFARQKARISRIGTKRKKSEIYTHRKLVFGFQNPISAEI